MSIQSFRNEETRLLFEVGSSRKFRNIAKVALRKLDMIDAAHTIEDLKSPPANYLEKLQGNRLGQYSIRINDQFRVCFNFDNHIATNVEIVDYH